jgi:hypothetical protein
MEAGGRRSSSHLFLVRIWTQPDLHGLPSWRGKLQHIPSGEAHSFEDWTSLVVFLLLLSGGAGSGAVEPMPQGVAPSTALPEPLDLHCTAALSVEAVCDTKGKDDDS